jgi:ubiquinone/menaquinone biosynthesis C-methylase UbiE
MNEKPTYTPVFFDNLKKAEEKHFWFEVRRKWIYDSIQKFVLPPARALEVGCGTGNISSFLSTKGYALTGCEFYREALDMAWPGFLKVQGDSNNLPFRDNSFDVVGLFDVIEHFEDDTAPLKEALRVVRKGGIIAVTVPARGELWSQADELSLHKRRYTKKRLLRVLSEAKLCTLLLKYMFMSLYIPMKYIRSHSDKESDHFDTNKLANTLLKGIFDVERLISKGLPLPLGTSLIAVARKKT